MILLLNMEKIVGTVIIKVTAWSLGTSHIFNTSVETSINMVLILSPTKIDMVNEGRKTHPIRDLFHMTLFTWLLSASKQVGSFYRSTPRPYHCWRRSHTWGGRSHLTTEIGQRYTKACTNIGGGGV